MVESTHPELQADTQAARLSFLFELLDYVRSADPFVMPPYFPSPGDPNDFGGGGSSGGDKKPGSDNSGCMVFGTRPDNVSADKNISVAGADETNDSAW